MGAIGGMLGLSGGEGGTGQNLTSGVSPEQLAAAYQGVQGGLTEQQRLLQALQAQQGLQNQGQVYSQLQNVVAGQGPNPAQAMLAQATGQNVANQAALMAGQRGAAANVGLMARQAAQAGSAAQQKAAADAATLQAQQSLGALGQAGAMANQQAQQQIGATQALSGAQLAQQAQLQQANAEMNRNRSGLAQQQMQGQQGMIGGLLGGAGAALMADGGEVPGDSSGPQSVFGKFVTGFKSPESSAPTPQQSSLSTGAAKFGSGIASAAKSSASMGAFASGGDVGTALKAGGHVPGKAAVTGDSLKNDTVHAMLSPGEVVIPRSVMQSKDPARGAADFVAAVLAKKRLGK